MLVHSLFCPLLMQTFKNTTNLIYPRKTMTILKMESTINAETDGTVAQVHIKPGNQVQTGDLVVTFE